MAAVPLLLNVDLGELPGEPDALYAIATQVNVACGGHAGDAASMAHACATAKRAGAKIAAHPSYPDREGFGRRTIEIANDALARSITEQCARLREAARANDAEVTAMKPHGALYHDASNDPARARAVVEGTLAALGAVAIVGPPGSSLAEIAAEYGLAYVPEGFADRAYDGERLRPRTMPGALLVEPAVAAAQALSLGRRGTFGTLCVHGDTPGAIEIARAVRAALEQAGLLA